MRRKKRKTESSKSYQMMANGWMASNDDDFISTRQPAECTTKSSTLLDDATVARTIFLYQASLLFPLIRLFFFSSSSSLHRPPFAVVEDNSTAFCCLLCAVLCFFFWYLLWLWLVIFYFHQITNWAMFSLLFPSLFAVFSAAIVHFLCVDTFCFFSIQFLQLTVINNIIDESDLMSFFPAINFDSTSFSLFPSFIAINSIVNSCQSNNLSQFDTIQWQTLRQRHDYLTDKLSSIASDETSILTWLK